MYRYIKDNNLCNLSITKRRYLYNIMRDNHVKYARQYKKIIKKWYVSCI
jgi:hypothetical protein